MEVTRYARGAKVVTVRRQGHGLNAVGRVRAESETGTKSITPRKAVPLPTNLVLTLRLLFSKYVEYYECERKNMVGMNLNLKTFFGSYSCFSSYFLLIFLPLLCAINRAAVAQLIPIWHEHCQDNFPSDCIWRCLYCSIVELGPQGAADYQTRKV